MNFEAVAKETFQILRSYDYEVRLYDGEANQVYEPEEARHFFALPENLMVSIVDDNEDSRVRVDLSKSTEIESIMGLVGAIRSMSTKYSMIFHLRKHGRVISPKDFSTKISVSENERSRMNILEGMYGTSRSSYLKLENARMIVRHSQRVDENTIGARGRNIDAIYIENGVGERYLFPVPMVAPARAMAHHVDFGGNWADPVGQQIARMATDFSNLAQVSRHIGTVCGPVAEGESATPEQDLRECIRSKLKEMRKTFEALCRSRPRYEQEAQKLHADATSLMEHETEDRSALVSELANMLNRENRTLSEAALESVARLVEMPRHDERSLKLITVLGRPVNSAAWDDFKSGKIALNGRPAVENREFANVTDELVNKLSAVANAAVDDSMGNLLSFVADELAATSGGRSMAHARADVTAAQHADAKAGDRARIDTLRRFGIIALRNAGLSIGPKAQSVAMREFAEWAASFRTERVLSEDNSAPRLREPTIADDLYSGKLDSQVDEIVNEFNVDDFLSSSYASDLMWDQRDELSDEEKTIDESEIVDVIEHYLSSTLAERGIEDDVDLRADAEHLASKVVPVLSDAGYAITKEPVETWSDSDRDLVENDIEDDAEMIEDDGLATETDAVEELEEDMELKREDVLLPKNQGEDLIKSVTKPTVTDPESGDEKEPDGAYLDRLTTLAGVRTPSAMATKRPRGAHW